LKIAIIHDWLTNMGGSENIIEILNEMFPEAPIYTIVYNRKKMPKNFKNMNIITSALQKIPFSTLIYQNLLAFMPWAVEQFDLSDFDLVISSSTCCSKGIITKADTLHICYCNTPMRYAWDFYHDYIKNKNPLFKFFISIEMKKIRIWDRLAADRVDFFIANSKNVQKRIVKAYRRESEIIFPPVNSDFYTPLGDVKDYFLVVSRLVPYKRIDIAIKAFEVLGLKLIVAGTGSEYKKYIKHRSDHIEFLGKQSNDELLELYRGARALIFPGEEDFGITPLEAQSCGRPVIAFKRGGVLETVIEERTGIFFNVQTPESLIGGINKFLKVEKDFDVKYIRQHAEEFSIKIFKDKIYGFIETKYHDFMKEE